MHTRRLGRAAGWRLLAGGWPGGAAPTWLLGVGLGRPTSLSASSLDTFGEIITSSPCQRPTAGGVGRVRQVPPREAARAAPPSWPWPLQRAHAVTRRSPQPAARSAPASSRRAWPPGTWRPAAGCPPRAAAAVGQGGGGCGRPGRRREGGAASGQAGARLVLAARPARLRHVTTAHPAASAAAALGPGPARLVKVAPGGGGVEQGQLEALVGAAARSREQGVGTGRGMALVPTAAVRRALCGRVHSRGGRGERRHSRDMRQARQARRAPNDEHGARGKGLRARWLRASTALELCSCRSVGCTCGPRLLCRPSATAGCCHGLALHAAHHSTLSAASARPTGPPATHLAVRVLLIGVQHACGGAADGGH